MTPDALIARLDHALSTTGEGSAACFSPKELREMKACIVAMMPVQSGCKIGDQAKNRASP